MTRVTLAVKCLHMNDFVALSRLFCSPCVHVLFLLLFCVLNLQHKFIRGTCINCKFCLLIGLISSHSPTILNNLHKSISRRLSEITNYKEIFEQVTDIYNSALEASGYNEGLEYINQEVRDGRARNKRKRERQIIWYNPPFSKSVTTNIAQKLIRLVDRHFPKKSKSHKIFNKNTLIVSYSCMSNMSTLIKAHNNRMRGNEKPKTTKDPIVTAETKTTAHLMASAKQGQSSTKQQ